MSRIKNIISGTTSILATIFIILGIIILVAAVSFVLFTFGYWLITIILSAFFGFILPFSWWYSLGAWLIAVAVGLFIAPGIFVTRGSND